MTTEERAPSRRRLAWPSPRHWSVRVKFAVVLLVPLVLAVALGMVRIADQIAEATERDRVARFVAVQGMVSSLVVDVERERYRAAEFVANGRVDGRALQGVVDAVDERAAQSRDAVGNLSVDVAGLALVQRQAEQALSRLTPLRELVTRSNAPAGAVIARYSELIEQLVQLDSALLRGVNTAEVNGLANGLAGLNAARNEVTLQQAQMAIAVRGGPPSPALAADLQFSDARLATGLAEFRVALDAAQRVRYAGPIAGSTNSDRTGLVQSVLAGAPAEGGVKTVGDVYGRFLGELDAAAEGLRAELSGTVAERRQSAVMQAWLNVVLLLLALVVGAVIVGLIARGMIASLRTLRRSAITVAQERLPEAVRRMRQGSVPNVNINAVPVTTREEVGQVARAFDAVHAQAVRLAAEQATLQNNINAMYINLSRRSQALVDRQLVLIEQLEEGEEDPEQLSDLFRLDHLATRMRRNCENLLVLAGTELTRGAPDPLPVVDVLRAAVSEIEHYQRVIVQNPPDATFAGGAASDIQHLLAELLDNATNFSPSDSQVVMSCSRARDDSILVEIFDDGIGLAPGELATLNERLRNPAEATATVAASRRMGLFVVGRLADRHGIWVSLFTDSMGTATGPGGPRKHGVTARVTVPAHLVGERADAPDPIAWSRIEAAPELPSRIVIPPGASGGTALPVRARERAEQGRPEPVRADTAPAGDAAAGAVTATSPATPPAASPLATRRPASARRHDEPDGETTMQMPVVSAHAGPSQTGPARSGSTRTASPKAASTQVGAAPVESTSVERTGPGPVEPAPPESERFELFEPAVPPLTLPDPAAPRPRDPLAAVGSDDGEATPIFAEVSSGWFHVAEPARSGGADPAAEEMPVMVSAGGRPAISAHAVDPARFATAADPGWRAAEAFATAQTEGVTKAGLPKRVPRGRLLPGSASPGAPPPTISGRDPDAVRGRLATFQRGLREGRGYRPDPDGASSSSS